MLRKITAVLLAAVVALGLPAAALAGTGPIVVRPSRPNTAAPAVVSQRSIPSPVSLTVSPASINLQVGQSQAIKAQVTFTDGSVRDAARNCVCIVSNSRVVSYRSGIITALSPGTATVTLRSYGKTAQIRVSVSKKEIPRPVSLAVSPASVELEVGQEQEFNAELTFSDGSVKDVSRNAVFIISNSRVISVRNGRIKALSPGSATLTIRSYGKTARVSVRVVEKAVEDPQEPGVREVPAVEFRGSVVTEDFEWEYAGETYKWRIDIPKDLLDWSRNVNETTKKYYEADGYTQYKMLLTMPSSLRVLVLAHSAKNEGDYTPWVKEPNNSSFMSALASALKERARKDNLDRFQTAELALAFVQQAISYELTEYPVLPSQALADRKGDCDVKSVLLAALLEKMGYDTALFYFDPSSTGKDTGHMAVGIAFKRQEVPRRDYPVKYYEFQGRNYYFAETTSEKPIGVSAGWKVTEIYPN